MTRFARRWVVMLLLAAAPAVFAQVTRKVGDEQPNAETLKRLAQQLQGNQQLPQNIDPELMKLAAEYLKKNPEILKDPQFQQQMKQWQQQAKNDPVGFAQQMNQQNPDLSPEQIDDLKKQFQQSKPNGFQPPPNIGPTPMPSPGDPRPPTDTQPQPPQTTPGQPMPGQPPQLFAVDKATGTQAGAVKIPSKTTAVPMTFLHKGAQYIVFATGAEEHTSLIALKLPTKK